MVRPVQLPPVDALSTQAGHSTIQVLSSHYHFVSSYSVEHEIRCKYIELRAGFGTFGPAWLHLSRPLGDKAVWPTQMSIDARIHDADFDNACIHDACIHDTLCLHDTWCMALIHACGRNFTDGRTNEGTNKGTNEGTKEVTNEGTNEGTNKGTNERTRRF